MWLRSPRLDTLADDMAAAGVLEVPRQKKIKTTSDGLCSVCAFQAGAGSGTTGPAGCSRALWHRLLWEISSWG